MGGRVVVACRISSTPHPYAFLSGIEINATTESCSYRFIRDVLEADTKSSGN
jgi:hypothetical protein